MNMDWLNKPPKWAFLVLAMVTVVLLGSVVRLGCDNATLRDEKTAAQNAGAQADRLRLVAENKWTKISERLSESDYELDASLVKNELLQTRLKDKEATVNSYANIISGFRLENERLRGRRGIDSSGGEFADFDTLTADYALSMRAQITPLPVLTINSFFTIDSTHIVNYETKDGVLYGAIGHTNKHVFDYGGQFFIKLAENTGSPALATIYWIIGGVLIIGAFLLGGAI